MLKEELFEILGVGFVITFAVTDDFVLVAGFLVTLPLLLLLGTPASSYILRLIPALI